MNSEILTKRSDAVSLMVVGGHLMAGVESHLCRGSHGPGVAHLSGWFLFGLSMNGILNLMHEVRIPMCSRTESIWMCWENGRGSAGVR